MTEYQEHQIRGLRMRGGGYKAIATATGLSRDIVRNYCKSHRLEGLASEFTWSSRAPADGGGSARTDAGGIGEPLTRRKANTVPGPPTTASALIAVSPSTPTEINTENIAAMSLGLPVSAHTPDGSEYIHREIKAKNCEYCQLDENAAPGVDDAESGAAEQGPTEYRGCPEEVKV